MSLGVLILSDSVALPRNEPELTRYVDTWPQLLKTKGYNIFQCSIGAATSSVIRSQCGYYNSNCFDFDVVVIHCGIVDCAPRFLKKSELEILRQIPYGNKIIKIFSKNWIRKSRKITYVNQKQFEKNLRFIKKNFHGKKIFFLSIIPATVKYEEILSGITKNIEAYNLILKKNVEVIDITGVEDKGMMKDYHHLNKNGHQFIFEKIFDRLNSL